MATGSQNMTTYNARIVTGSNSAASPAGALLLSGAGRADDASGDTWLFLDSRGGTSTPWGIKHDQANNQIQIFGAGTNSVWTQMNTGNTYIGGNLNTGSVLTVRAQNNTHEGGEIILSPATSSFVTVHVDAYDNLFRLHDGTNERFKVNVSTGNATVMGKLGVNYNSETAGNTYQLYVNGNACIYQANSNVSTQQAPGLRVNGKIDIYDNVTGGGVANSLLNILYNGTHEYGVPVKIHSYGGDSPAIRFSKSTSIDDINKEVNTSWTVGMYYNSTDAFAITRGRGPAGWGTADLVINSSGNVGIGTTSPTYKLHINGTTYHADHVYLAAAKHIYMSYNSTNYNILHNHNNGNISVNAAGTGLYMAYQNTTFVNWMNGRMELRDGCLSLFPNNSSYREGLRIHATGSWSDITLCGNDNTGNSGTSANSWFIGNNNGNFYIARNGSSSGTSLFGCVGNVWKIYGNQANSKSKQQSILHIYGPTYGNTAADMVSGTAGLFSWGDGGPQITFDTSGTPGGGQAGALIFTDNDNAAAGASWHFVSNQSDWNVTSKRFHAKTSISIGSNLPNTSYNFVINGTANHTTGYWYINGGAGGIINGAATNGGLNSIRIGDDVWLGDCNQGGIMGMKSTGANTGFYFYNSSGTNTGQFYTNGTNFVCNKPISRDGVSKSWINGRDNAIIRTTSYSGYDAILSMKTTNGAWELGVYSSNEMFFTYTPDSNYNSGTNSGYTHFRFNPNGYMYGNFSGYLSGNISGSSSSCTGNSATTSKLADSAHSWTATEVYNYMTARVLKAGDTMTGKLTISANVLPMLQLTRSDASEVSIYWANNTAGWAAGIHAWGVGAGQFAIGQYSGTGSSKWRLRIDNNGYVYTSSYLNLGGGHEKNASSPTYVWGSNSSDTYLRSYQTSHLSVSYAASAGAVAWGNVSSKPDTATRWPSWSEVTSKPAVQNNLTSTSTTDMLSAAQGKALNDNKTAKGTGLAYTTLLNQTYSGTSFKSITVSNISSYNALHFACYFPNWWRGSMLIPVSEFKSHGVTIFFMINDSTPEYANFKYISDTSIQISTDHGHSLVFRIWGAKTS